MRAKIIGTCIKSNTIAIETEPSLVNCGEKHSGGCLIIIGKF